MKGPLHERLRALLADATARGLCTQESLGRAMGKTQTSVGAYLRSVKGGAIDLDEADAALRHIGSSLAAFIAGQTPRELSPTERMARELESRPALQGLVAGLIRVPKPRLSELIAFVSGLARIATGPPGASSTATNSAPSEEGRTRPGPTQRPRVLTRKKPK